MDPVDRRVRRQLLKGAARAYGLTRPDEGFDPQLCRCQRERPLSGTDRCVHCTAAVAA